MSRSYLFIPGNTPGMIQQMDIFESDAVILDLEDSVLHYDKDAARILVKNYFQQVKDHDIELFVRLNDVESPYFKEDIQTLNGLPLHGLVLPKASIQAVDLMASMTDFPIIPIIETPLAVLDVKAIAAHPQVKGLLLGAEDLTKEMNIKRTDLGIEIDYARHHVVMACHAFQKEAIDTPWVDKDNWDGLKRDASYAKSLGYTGKALIHPNHVTIVNQVFVPSQEEITQAKRIIKKAEETNKGAFTLDGKMVDIPIIEKARKLLEIAKRYQLL